jgi:hypothetical protein
MAAELSPVFVAADLSPVFVAAELYPVFVAAELNPVFVAAERFPVFMAAELFPVFVAADLSPVFVAADLFPVFDCFAFVKSTLSRMNFTPALINAERDSSALIWSDFATRLVSESHSLSTSWASISANRLSDGL